MEIIYFDKIDSTQKRLILDLEKLNLPIAYFTQFQTDGVGSRGNSWIGQRGNFFLSFAIKKDSLPKDLPLSSASIYFSYLLKMVLAKYGSKVWIKWPNDFYLSKKIGGTITNLKKDVLVVGIGLNLVSSPKDFEKLDINIEPKKTLEAYFGLIEEKILWKEIFSKYKIEFQKSKNFEATINGMKVSLKNASLLEDGSLMINGERIYNLR